jgi:hypothetical protein
MCVLSKKPCFTHPYKAMSRIIILHNISTEVVLTCKKVSGDRLHKTEDNVSSGMLRRVASQKLTDVS